ncbi:glycosyltransferase family protein [Candidatus Pelagibacter bacterium]|nr:glycosyltransferase family protein [Candidatus Pelagibacter bacterium]
MKVVAIVQARMSSSRLPGKVMMKLVNKPVLAHIVERLSYCKMIENIVVATTTETSDDLVKDYCTNNKIDCYRGDLEDVLDRYYHAAKIYHADPIVRITCDCPVIDPVVVDMIINGYLSGEYDCYGLGGKFPDGLDCTVYSFSALEKAWREAKLKSEREHVGPYIEKNPNLFKNGSLELFQNLDHHRWTLDVHDDYELLNKIFNALYRPDSPFLVNEILKFMQSNPTLLSINNKVIRNEGYLESLKKDKIVK